MKRIFSRILVSVLSAVLLSCGGKGGDNNGAAVSEVQASYQVKGVSFEMVTVPGGTFGMGAKSDKSHFKGSPVTHQVVLDGYAISKLPVSQALWEAVTGGNPSSVKSPELPVDRVSWDDCNKFISKLSKITGVPFRLPSEAMWEFAYDTGAIQDIKSIDEWCSDGFVENPEKAISRNPEGDAAAAMKTVRNALERRGLTPINKTSSLSFRLAVNMDVTCPPEVLAAIVEGKPEREHVCSKETVDAGGVKIKMLPVKGGVFEMGNNFVTDVADEDEYPVHEVSVEDFELSETEVTTGLWKAVMGTIPVGNYTNVPENPVVNISWYAAQEFILKLNALTGRKFRLPSEAEWEYAARGGRQSRGYRYSGGDYIREVAVVKENSDGHPREVRSKRPNELGLYDMSGNVWEWCQDYYGGYGDDLVQLKGSDVHVMRGGSYNGNWQACRVCNRQAVPADNTKSTFGFRLAL